MKKILFFILVCCLPSCSIGDGAKESDLKGSIENNQFKNKYLTIKITDGWKSDLGSDEYEFLSLRRNDDQQEAVISFSAFRKDLGDKIFYSKEYANQKLIEGIKSDNKELKSVYENRNLTVDGMGFLVTKFTFEKESETYQMIYYTGELKDFYLLIFFSDDDRKKEQDVNKVISSIKFNK